jgi:hypothetical protein
MNIILGKDNVDNVSERYIVLELDTLRLSGATEPVTAYCVLDQIALQDIVQLDQWRELHQNLIKNYRLKNWNFCQQAIEHLTGHWQNELDTFYADLSQRVKQYQVDPPGDAWDGVLDRS